MKLSIFGRHPIPQGGFNGVMSLFEAIEFSRLGYETTLLIPFADKALHQEFLSRHEIRTLNDLPRLGGCFDILPVFPDGENFHYCDVLIFQSYDPNDWLNFEHLIRSKTALLTKNFPKFVSSPQSNTETLDHLLTFGLVACALREDVNFLSSNRDYNDQFPGGFAYVPRGACPEWLHPGYKCGLPLTIGFDAPNQPDIRALEHYIEPIKKLRSEFQELRTLSLGRSVDELGSSKISFGRFDHIYENFFNKIHVYCTINYMYSPDHLTSPVQKSTPGWQHKPIYELQNIEAQMSGALIFGHQSNLISELYRPGITGINFSEFSSEDEIYRGLKHALEHWRTLSIQARQFAEEKFSWSYCIGLWSNAIQMRLPHVPKKHDKKYIPIGSTSDANSGSLTTLEFTSPHQFEGAGPALEDFYLWSEGIGKELAENVDEFYVPGYCVVCEAERNFRVDYNYALPNARAELKPNWRERLVCPTCSLNSRLRACIHMTGFAGLKPSSQIYASEQVTPLFRVLQSRFANLTGSEFLTDGTAPGQTNKRGIRHEDMTHLSFANASLDGVVSFECLEHIPDYRGALAECRRVLRDGGTLLMTAPFLINSAATLVRARVLPDGSIEHLLPAEYHGDPVNAEGVLCYYHFGWDLLNTLRDVGFSETKLVIYGSRAHGYFGGVPSMIIAKA